MKSLSKYIIEKVGDLNTGFWEPFEDEDTGEIINFWGGIAAPKIYTSNLNSASNQPVSSFNRSYSSPVR